MEEMSFEKHGKRKKMKKWVLEKMGKGRKRKEKDEEMSFGKMEKGRKRKEYFGNFI